MELEFDFLKRLVSTPGVSGQEEQVRELILSHSVCKKVSSASVDRLGNLVLDFGGEGPTVLLDAHMDEVGFMVRRVDKRGFVWFIPLGGMDVNTVAGQRVVVHGRRDLHGVIGQPPPHLSRLARSNGSIEMNDLFVDLGMDASRVKEMVRPGDAITFPAVWEDSEDAVFAKALDDRVGIFVILQSVADYLASYTEPSGFRLLTSFTVQEENGLKGAGPVFASLQPDLVLVMEGTVCNDLPGTSDKDLLAIAGKGPEIRLSDGRFLAHGAMAATLQKLAEESRIPYQVVVKSVGGTNAAMFQVQGRGCMAGALSVPVRYIHSPSGVARKDDIFNTVRLLSLFLENLKKLF